MCESCNYNFIHELLLFKLWDNYGKLCKFVSLKHLTSFNHDLFAIVDVEALG